MLARYGRHREGDFPEAGRVRCPRMGPSTLFPGGLGIMSSGIMTGAGGASLGWDRRRRVTPVQTTSQETWPEAEPWGRRLPLARAVVGRRQTSCPAGQRRTRWCGGYGSAFVGVLLPYLSVEHIEPKALPPAA